MKDKRNLHKGQTQLKTILLYLRDHIATASMVAQETQVPQKNITRYKRDLEKAGLLAEVKKAPCELTKFPAHYLTCNPNLFPAKNQLTMFSDGK